MPANPQVYQDLPANNDLTFVVDIYKYVDFFFTFFWVRTNRELGPDDAISVDWIRNLAEPEMVIGSTKAGIDLEHPYRTLHWERNSPLSQWTLYWRFTSAFNLSPPAMPFEPYVCVYYQNNVRGEAYYISPVMAWGDIRTGPQFPNY